MIERSVKKDLVSRLFGGRVLVLYGARRAGKTTLVREILREFDGSDLYLNCDEPDIRLSLEGCTSTGLKRLFGDVRLAVIDEAQRVKDIGLTLKLAADSLPDIQVIATGSSSFELANRTVEPLTGRKFEFHLHPLTLTEFEQTGTPFEVRRLLPERVVYGMYPEVSCAALPKAEAVLRELAGSYLYKDVLAWKDIRHPEILDRLLRALALQTGSQVSYSELSSTLGIAAETVETYVRVLEQAFIVFRLPPYSRNLRTELRKLRKIYFWDTGIRNAVLNDFRSLENRPDAGAIWENFVISERMKALGNAGLSRRSYFWRTHQKQEVDYLEEADGSLLAAEIKRTARKTRIPLTFRKAYPEAATEIIDPSRVWDFVKLP